MKKLPGVHAPHKKNTARFPAVPLPAPKLVRIPMSMHIGAPAKPVVAVGDAVKVGQLIGEAAGAVSADIYASVSGTVSKIQDSEPATGERGTIVVIESDGLQSAVETSPPEVSDLASFLAAVRASGVVGLGGAGFPTAAKLSVKDVSQIEYVIVNGAECEPYITADTRTFIDDAELVWSGVRLLSEYLGVRSIIIGIEDNKPEAIAVMKKYCAAEPIASVASLPALYPQGGEKMLIYNLTGRAVPEGKLPLDAGAIVINVTTLAAIARYIGTGMPLVSKRVTVDGSAVPDPKNVIVPIGTPVEDVLGFCGVKPETVRKLLLGGPMMGAALPSAALPVKKQTNAILAFTEADAEVPKEKPCMRCGRCVSHCPMRLTTVEIQLAYQANKPKELERLKVGLCIECGCCTFSCPAKRPLTQYMKLAKAELRNYQNLVKAQAEREAAKLAAKTAKEAAE
ncbi:MAG: electron transport complex subunit RsxC [Oscillospiraceae bacterium]|nr:electron transport complex subunit RsxC [Oscillospiraceae bacterium]